MAKPGPYVPGPGVALGLMVGVTASVVMLYAFFYSLEMALIRYFLPVVAPRTQGLFSRLAGLVFYVAPALLLLGPLYAWKCRVEGATKRGAWRLAGASWLATALLFGLGLALVYLGAA